MSLRVLLLERLVQLSSPQFEEVLFGLESSYPALRGKADVPGGTQSQRAMQLIRFVEQDANGLSRLCKQLAEPFTVPCTAVVELQNLLQQEEIAEETVRHVFYAYLNTLGEQAKWVLPDLSIRPLWDCLFDYLLDPSWMKSSGQNHLINFIGHLAPHVNSASQRRALQKWVSKTAAELGISKPRFPPNPDLQEESQTYLLLAVSPEGGYYTLRAWFTDTPEVFDRISEKSLGSNLDNLPKRLKEVLDDSKVTEACLRGNAPILEFFLPVNLLNRDLDEWTPTGEKRPLSAQYGLVVRAGERLWGKYWLPNWGRTWKDLRKVLGEKVGRRRTAWLSCPEDCRCSRHLRSGRCVIGLWFVPDTENFETLLGSGVAILLWSRVAMKRTTQDQLKRQLAREAIKALPEWLRQMRTDHWERSQRIEPLSLLWDDPQRLPDDYQPMESHPDLL